MFSFAWAATSKAREVVFKWASVFIIQIPTYGNMVSGLSLAVYTFLDLVSDKDIDLDGMHGMEGGGMKSKMRMRMTMM